MKKNLTQLEIPRLPETFNLTDGHAHRSLDKNEQAVIDRLSEIYELADREQQPAIEEAYLAAFYKLTRQSFGQQKARYLLMPTASMSLEVVANYLRLQKLSLAFVEPCFDNLADIFKRHDIRLEPLPDYCMEAENWGGVLDKLQSQAICIVAPNNPTGNSYSEANFRQLVDYCKKHSKLLILDTCFRPYYPEDKIFDEHAILQSSGIDYVVIDDTGKTWPTKELKVSILATSPNLYASIYDIYSDFILHHSPFVVKLLTEFFQNSLADGLRGVHEIVATNRQILMRALKDTCMTVSGKPFASVAWLEIKGDKTAEQLVEHFADSGVFVLPGNQFFWNSPSLGDKHIRVALVRDPDMFKAATDRMRATLKTLGN